MSFRELSNSKRKSFLYELFGYSWFETLEKHHKDLLKQLEMEYKVYETEYKELSEWDYNREESNLKQKLQEKKEKVAKEKKEIENVESKILLLNRSLINYDEEKLHNGEEDKISILDNIKKKETKVKSLEKSLETWVGQFDEDLYKKVLISTDESTNQTVFSNNKSVQMIELQDHDKKMREMKTSSLEEIDDEIDALQRKVVDTGNSFDVSKLATFPEKDLDIIECKVAEITKNICDMNQLLKGKYIKISQEDLTKITPNAFKKVKNAIIRQKNNCKVKMKELNEKKREFKEFHSMKESIEEIIPLYKKHEKTKFFQQYKPGGYSFNYKKEEWKKYYNEIRCDVDKEPSISKDALHIDELDKQITSIQEEMMQLSSSSSLKSSEYTKYSLEIKEFESTSETLPLDNIKFLYNETVLDSINKLKEIASILESQKKNQETLIETIADCSKGISINKKCDACLNNPFNQKNILRKKTTCS